MSKISIIIPHYNGYEILSNCLKSLYESELYDAEIIIINNNSTDDSIDKIESDFPKTTTINLNENKGYAGGCNHGANHASGEFLVFLNNDTEVTKNWLTELINTINNDPSKIKKAKQPRLKL